MISARKLPRGLKSYIRKAQDTTPMWRRNLSILALSDERGTVVSVGTAEAEGVDRPVEP